METREGYKKTKIGWIPEDWNVIKLASLTNKVGSGVTPKGGSEAYLKSGIPFFRSQNVLKGKISLKDIVFISEKQHQKMKSTQLKTNDVLLNITGASIGRCCVIPETIKEGNVNQHVCIIRGKKIINPHFISNVLTSNIGQKQIWAFQAGGNREGLNFQQIKSFNIPLPPLPEQQKIAAILSTVDKKIESIEEQIKQTEQLKKGLMNKLLTEGIGHTEFKDTKIGRVPKTWDVQKLGDIGFLKNGINKGKEDFGQGVPFVNLMDVFGKTSISNTNFGLVLASQKEQGDYNLLKGDVIFVRSSVKPSGVGLTVLVEEDLKDTVYSGFLIRFREQGHYLINEFKKYCFHENKFRNRLLAKSSVSANTNINQESLKSLKIIVPPLPEQQKIATILGSIDEKIDVLHDKKSKYEFLKKGLMQQLLTGWIRVKL